MRTFREFSDNSLKALLAAISTISDLVYVYDEDFRFVYANEAFLELWDAEPSELIGHKLRDWLRDDQLADRLERQIEHVLQTGEMIQDESHYRSPAGKGGYFEYIFRRYQGDGHRWVVGSTRDITDRMRLAEQTARANQSQAEILESITDAFYALDDEWRFVYVNTRAAQILKRDRDELIGKVVWDEFPETLETVIHPNYLRARQRQKPASFEFYYPTLETWFEVNVYPRADRLSVYFRDISAAVVAAETLTASERRYRTLTDAMPQLVWLTDAAGNHIYFNQRWYEYTGLSEGESLGFGFANALHPDDAERSVRRWEQAWRGGDEYEIEYRFYSRERDEYRWFLGRAMPVRDEHGSIVEWVGTCTDIEPQKQTELALFAGEVRLAEAQRIARLGNWELDLQTGAFDCSAEHCRIFGVPRPEGRPDLKTFSEKIHPDDRSRVRATADQAIAEGGSYDIEYRIVRPDGSLRTIHTIAEVIVDRNREPVRLSGTAQDVTERRELDRALQNYAEQQAQLTNEIKRLNVTLEQQVDQRTRMLSDRAGALQDLSVSLEQVVRERTAELDASRAELAYRAQHDMLTGLSNRVLLEDRLAHALSGAERSGAIVAVLFVDLDGFKLVNDSMGHAAGDSVLKEVARRLTEGISQTDTVARIGADEFVAVLEHVQSALEVHQAASAIGSSLSRPYELSDRSIRLTASIGVSLFPQDSSSPSSLLRNADLAMYQAKQSGKNDVQFFSPTMNVEAEERVAIASHLDQALGRGEFEVHFQPQLDTATQKIGSFEALLRWSNPTLGSVPPVKFIPIAEETGLIIELGKWVLEQSCRQAATWSELVGEEVRIAVNVAPSQLQREDFSSVVADVISRCKIRPAQIELELTERTLLRDVHRLIDQLEKLQELGVRIAMDDFGAGNSSLGNLARLPIDTIKIDRSFVQNLAENSPSDRIIQAVVSMAHGIGLEIVAEGVETDYQLQRVTDLGCSRVQGYLIGRPASAETIESAFLRKTRVGLLPEEDAAGNSVNSNL